ncbi:hypothetical protein K0A96_02680, partial [Patescibacteria group bacterium]|nr:hypothetical protein [Patescibacteria group bacterium]
LYEPGLASALFFTVAAIFTFFALRDFKGLVRETLVIRPALFGRAKKLVAPGWYDYRIFFDKANGPLNYDRYVVLVKSAGSKGFAMTKLVFTVNGYYGDLQEDLMDLSFVSPEAYKEIMLMITRKDREAESESSLWNYRSRKVKEIAELIKS